MTVLLPTQKDVEIALKTIQGSQPSPKDESKIEAIRRVGTALNGSSFDPEIDGHNLSLQLEDLVVRMLSRMRTRLKVEVFDEDKEEVEVQLKKDFAVGHIDLEQWSVLWANYVYGYKRSDILTMVAIDVRTYDDRLKKGREKLTRLVIPQKSGNVASEHEPSESVRHESVEVRNPRQRLLNIMQQDWIEDYYENSLDQRAPIVLGMTNRPELVQGPWVDVEQGTAQSDGELEQGTTIVDVWERYRRALLIVGEAGVGKTNALLELAEELLERAYVDAAAPAPAYFHLASWNEQQQSFEAWLEREFKRRYDIDAPWIKQAIKDRALILLLDGLDTVAASVRERCVNAINAFRDGYRSIGMAVCCRYDTAVELPERLHLHAAVQLQRLTPAEIREQLVVLTAWTEGDFPGDDTHPLYELLAIPLMLDVFVRTYRQSVSMPQITTRFPVFQGTLFDAYIDAMFKTKSEAAPFDKTMTLHSLHWIANQMGQHGTDPHFELERLDSSWLSHATRKDFVRKVRLWRSFVLGIALGLPAVSGMAVVFIEMFGSLLNIRVGPRTMFVALVIGCVLMIGLLGVLSQRHITAQSQERINPVEKVFSAKPIRWPLMLAAIFLGCVTAYTTGILYGPWWGIIFGGSVIAIIVLLASLSSLDGRAYDVEERIRPNEGIRRSGRYALMYGLLTLLVVCPTAALITSISVGAQLAAIIGPAFGLGITLIMMFYFGGDAWSVHTMLRRALEREGVIPRDLPGLLDFAVARVLMYRSGGRYLFIHELFQKHLATNDRLRMSNGEPTSEE